MSLSFLKHRTKSMHNKNIVLFAFIFVLMMPAAMSQSYEVGVFGGGSYYSGDLNPGPEGQFRQTEPAFGGLVRYNFDKHLSVRITGLHGSVKGTDENSAYDILPPATQDIYIFESTITEVSLQGEVNFLPYIAGHVETLITPYIFGGIGYFMFDTSTGHGDGSHWHPDEVTNPTADPGEFTPPEDYSNFSFSYLMGGGLKHHITEYIGGGFEWGLRYTGTNYLDQVNLKGNPKQNDWYAFAGITITFRFKDSKRAICPY